MTRMLALKELLAIVDADDARRTHKVIFAAADPEKVRIARPRRRKKPRCLTLLKKRA